LRDGLSGGAFFAAFLRDHRYLGGMDTFLDFAMTLAVLFVPLYCA
jgi:hypothetical protein